jgi:hypothetical protein
MHLLRGRKWDQGPLFSLRLHHVLQAVRAISDFNQRQFDPMRRNLLDSPLQPHDANGLAHGGAADLGIGFVEGDSVENQQ